MLLGRRHGVGRSGSGVAHGSSGVSSGIASGGSGVARGGSSVARGSSGIGSGISSGVHGRSSSFGGSFNSGFRRGGFLLGAGGQREGRNGGGKSKLRLHFCVPQEREQVSGIKQPS